MPQDRRELAGFSPTFLAAVVAEIALVQRRLDRLDERLERAKGKATRDRLSAERARQVRYERFLRRLLR